MIATSLIRWCPTSQQLFWSLCPPVGEGCPLGSARWHLCGHCKWDPPQSDRSRHHWHCGGQEGGDLLLWDQTSRLVLMGFRTPHLTLHNTKTAASEVPDKMSMEWNHRCPLNRPNCGAADRNGPWLRKNPCISAPRPGGQTYLSYRQINLTF